MGPLALTEQSENIHPNRMKSAAINILFSEKNKHSWVFPTSTESATLGSTPDKYKNSKTIHQLYENAAPDFSGKCTVPLLFDLKTNQIVNNEVQTFHLTHSLHVHPML